MIVNAITASDFTVFPTSGVRIDFPSKGVVLVTGNNGGGKSSMVEAVAFGFWGRTLRGSKPWVEGGNNTHLAVAASEIIVTRNAKKYLVYNDGAGPHKCETPTKTQEAIERVIGSFDVWRRTHVFSSQDASHFSLATDAERKRLLESLLGLERFDAALDRCRNELKYKRLESAAQEREFAVMKAKLEAEQRRVQDAQTALAELGTPEDVDVLIAEHERLVAEFAQTEACAAAARHRVNRETEVQRALGMELGNVRRECERVAGGLCSTCARPYHSDEVEVANARIEAARAHYQLAMTSSMADQNVGQLEVEGFEGALRNIQHNDRDIGKRIAKAEMLIEQRKKLQAVLASVTDDEDERRSQYDALARVVAALSTEVEELEAAADVLCLTGVRAHLLGAALSGIEGVANAWLGRLAGSGLQLTLKPYAEKANGGIRDAVSLDVLGAGGGHGYQASSAGERRRIDVALLMALAEVSAAVHGVEPGTLFFDEVFDALDVDGVDAVCAVLEDLGRERCVVVITHNQDIVQRLPRSAVAQHLRVSSGIVEKV